jgi:hypothetical protein
MLSFLFGQLKNFDVDLGDLDRSRLAEKDARDFSYVYVRTAL